MQPHDHVFAIEDQNPGNRRYVNGIILGESFKFLIDTGTTVNILDEVSYTSKKHKINTLRIVS